MDNEIPPLQFSLSLSFIIIAWCSQSIACRAMHRFEGPPLSFIPTSSLSVHHQDLIKYYLVACHKAKNKSKLTEFFTNFSKEILSRSTSSAESSSNAEELRKWYVLPYLEDPADD